MSKYRMYHICFAKLYHNGKFSIADFVCNRKLNIIAVSPSYKTVARDRPLAYNRIFYTLPGNCFMNLANGSIWKRERDRTTFHDVVLF